MGEMVIDPGFHEAVFRPYDGPEGHVEEYKAYRRMWTEYPKQYKVSDFPMHLDLEICKYCNLKCVFCPRAVQDVRATGQELMSKEMFEKAFDEGVPYGLKFNWLNEPTVDPRLPDFVKYASEKGVIDIQMNTNGTLVTKKLARRLIDAGMHKISFSIESISKSVYEGVRIGSNFELVMKNVAGLVEERGNSRTPYIRVQKVRFPTTESENEQFIKTFRDMGVDSVGLLSYREPDPKLQYNPNPGHIPCAQLWQRLIIKYNGTIVPCCRDRFDGYSVGNLKEVTIKQAWHSDKLNLARKLHADGTPDLVGICKNCEITKGYS